MKGISAYHGTVKGITNCNLPCVSYLRAGKYFVLYFCSYYTYEDALLDT
jgi:hypothetical protein